MPRFEGVELSSASGNAGNNDGWQATRAEAASYAQIFAQADADQDGFVTGAEAKDLLGYNYFFCFSV